MSNGFDEGEEVMGRSTEAIYATELRALKDGDFVYVLRGNDHKALLKVAAEIEEELNTLHAVRVKRRTELNNPPVTVQHIPTGKSGRRY